VLRDILPTTLVIRVEQSVWCVCVYAWYCLGQVRRPRVTRGNSKISSRCLAAEPLRGGGSGGCKLPLAPRQRRGPAIPQNEFLSPLGMKAEVDNSNVNFSQLCDDVSSTIEQLFSHCHCAAHALCLLYSEEMNDPCDFVQFSYYGVILLSVISYHFSCQCYSTRQKLLLQERH